MLVSRIRIGSPLYVRNYVSTSVISHQQRINNFVDLNQVVLMGSKNATIILKPSILGRLVFGFS